MESNSLDHLLPADAFEVILVIKKFEVRVNTR